MGRNRNLVRGSASRHRPAISVGRGIRVAAMLSILSLVLSACASRDDGNGADSVDSAVAKKLQKEGEIGILDHQFSSATIQAQLIAQVLEKLGGEAKVVAMADLNASFAAVAKQANLFDPEQWRLLTEASFKKYVENEKSVVSFAKSHLSGEEGWYVPTYVIEGDKERGIEPTCPGLPDWKALNDCAKVFATARTGDKGQLMSPSKAYDESYGNAQRIKNLGLNYQLEFAGSASALDAEWKRAVDKGEPFLAMNWKPSFTGLTYDITRVDLPPYTPECWETTYACNWGDVDVQSVANPKFEKKYPTYASILRAYDLDDKQILDIMTDVQENGTDPADAVATWIDENPKVWQGWAS